MAQRGQRQSRAQEQYRTAAGDVYAQQAQDRVEMTEERLRAAEQYLGTEEQIAGELSGVDPAYTERLTINPETLSAYRAVERNLGGDEKKQMRESLERLSANKDLFTRGMLPEKHNYFQTAPIEQIGRLYNLYMEDAQAAAEAGDTESAEELRKKATDAMSYLRLTGADPYDLFTKSGDADAEAQAMLSSPMARTVGGLLGEARELSEDPYGQRATELKESMTAGARREIDYGRVQSERSLAAGRREAARGARDFALAAGGARNVNALNANLTRISEGFASEDARLQESASQELASISASVEQWFQTFSRDYAAQTANMAQAFLQNSAGIRDQFVQATLTLSQASMQYADAAAGRSQDWAKHQAEMTMRKYEAQMQAGTQMGTTALNISGEMLADMFEGEGG